MINKMIFEIESSKGKRIGRYYAPLLHGYISEIVDKAYADVIHESGLHPYSQYLIEENNQTYWVVSALNSEAKEKISEVLKTKEKIYIKHKDEELSVRLVEEEDSCNEELIQKYYLSENDRYLKLNFWAPTSFKKDNEYIIYPNLRLIFQSLMRKYDLCTDGTKIFDEQLLEDIVKNTKIINYKLKSTFFSMESVKIPSYTGTVTIRIGGPAQMVNAVWLLAAFGEYSGVGIKTGLGMGGYQILKKKDKKSGE